MQKRNGSFCYNLMNNECKCTIIFVSTNKIGKKIGVKHVSPKKEIHFAVLSAKFSNFSIYLHLKKTEN